MTTDRQQLANRRNASFSCGPRTAAGLARASRNALKAGLFSKIVVLEALGESQDEYDTFRNDVVSDLVPVGALERELVERAGLLLWRLRRVVRYEVAAMSTSLGDLPPHPDAVEPLAGDAVCFPLPQGATTAFKLGHLKARMSGAPSTLAAHRAATAAIDTGADPRAPVVPIAARVVLAAAGDELGWAPYPDPWPDVLASAGLKRHRVPEPEWTGSRLHRVLACAAGRTGRAHEEFLAALHERLRRDLEELERFVAERRKEERQLADELLRERERVAAARLFADEGLSQRVARAESHLAHQLDRTLALLARIRTERVAAPAVRAVGFVLRDGEPANRPLGLTASESG